MKISILTGGAIACGIFLYLVYKIVKTNKLFSARELRELVKPGQREGAVRLSWIISTPAWIKVLHVVSLLTFLLFFAYQGYLHMARNVVISPGWNILVYLILAIVILAFSQRGAGRYCLTDQGIWVARCGVLSNPGKSRAKEVCRLRWTEAREVEFKAREAIFYRRIPGGAGPYSLPPRLLRRIRAFELPLPRDDNRARAEETIKQLIRDAGH
ncbi:MAG: hypothetical protein GY859_09770 [Desulfobacterales bacterium]|nr:hypothetical protein [Desulfobacterales bacterium]